MQKIENEIKEILNRNKRVELDKKWEMSLMRRFSITLFTYIVAYLFLYIVDIDNAEIAAIVPAGGYWLSQLGIKPLRNIWEKCKK